MRVSRSATPTRALIPASPSTAGRVGFSEDEVRGDEPGDGRREHRGADSGEPAEDWIGDLETLTPRCSAGRGCGLGVRQVRHLAASEPRRGPEDASAVPERLTAAWSSAFSVEKPLAATEAA